MKLSVHSKNIILHERTLTPTITCHILPFATTHVVDMAICQGRGASKKQDWSQKQHLSFFLKVLVDLVEGELHHHGILRYIYGSMHLAPVSAPSHRWSRKIANASLLHKSIIFVKWPVPIPGSQKFEIFWIAEFNAKVFGRGVQIHLCGHIKKACKRLLQLVKIGNPFSQHKSEQSSLVWC